MVAALDRCGEVEPYASFINEVEKVVISDSLDEATWNNARIVRRADAAEELGKLRAERTGTIGTWGSLTVVRWMAQNDLIDRLHLIVAPTVVGEGDRLFPELASKVLHPVEIQALSKGVQSLVFDVGSSTPRPAIRPISHHLPVTVERGHGAGETLPSLSEPRPHGSVAVRRGVQLELDVTWLKPS